VPDAWAGMNEREVAMTVLAFKNFLSWGAKPNVPGWPDEPRHVPPAWWAYVLGHTRWCPPIGEL
jgi:hypothetical protein